MIINIRGTSGSGKSTLVRSIKSLYLGPKLKFHADGRKQPIGYIHHRNFNQPAGHPLGLVGHYETDCGGCDTISDMDTIFRLALEAHGKGLDVLFEGLLISADVNRTVDLWLKTGRHKDDAENQLHVIALDVPIEECLDSVNGRRKGKAERTGRDYKGDVNPKNTISKHKGVKQSCERLRQAGVPVHVLGRVAAYNKIKELFQL